MAGDALDILRRIEALNGLGSQIGHQTNGHIGQALIDIKCRFYWLRGFGLDSY